MSSVEEITVLIAAKAEEIRVLKAEKATKEVITPVVAELLALKEKFKAANGGVPFDPPKAEVPKKEAAAPVEKGPSKKSQLKAAREEKEKLESAGSTVPPSAAAVPTSTSTSEAVSAPRTPSPANPSIPASTPTSLPLLPPPLSLLLPTSACTVPTVTYCVTPSYLPELSLLTTALLPKTRAVAFSVSTGSTDHLPSFSSSECPSGLAGDAAISRYLVRQSGPEFTALLGSTSVFGASLVDQWLDYYTACVAGNGELLGLPELINTVLASKTFLAGENLTLADISIFVLLRKMKFSAVAPGASTAFPNLNRWFSLVTFTLEGTGSTLILTGEKKYPPKGAGKAGGKASKDEAKNAAKTEAVEEEGGTCPALEGAEEGMVCTRFPPEPSGYLHIGHAKAVLLNQYYAQRYKGRLIVRFDDTNPSKEKEEYADNILLDLATLGVKPDTVTHTSDSFAKCEELARRMIKEGKAYMDNTDQETMQAERMEHKESSKRNTTPAENIALFELLLKGDVDTRTYCLRARIDMASLNGTLRDPVLYRFNETPHHRTGTKYKAYPTYDFACPIVDSIEGVTHALRTTEYNDRDEQYHWIQNALNLRKVTIYSFGKMNFIHTVLSKRKLNWFVENNLVEGWFDPRFPTIQGCIRRGVNVDALKSFIIGQGASRRVITMEWDKFWSVNKSVLEETCPRYMGVSTVQTVIFTVTNLPFSKSSESDEGISCVSVQVHPQKPEHGMRIMRQFHRILVDQQDAASFKEGEEVTFLRWGNFIIDKITKNEANVVLSMEGRFDATATNFSKTKKTTWLADVPDLVQCKIFEFDHLIAKAKLGEDENFQDFLNPVTKIESEALCDPCLRNVQAGQVIQLERKGFYRCDVAYGGVGKPVVLFAIPDGKQVKGTAVVPVKSGGKK